MERAGTGHLSALDSAISRIEFKMPNFDDRQFCRGFGKSERLVERESSMD